MVVTLKVILAISVLLGMTSTSPLQLMAKFKRSALGQGGFPYRGNLIALQKNISNAATVLQACGHHAVNEVKFSNPPEYKKTFCLEYKKTFCLVNKALQSLSGTNCSHIIPRFRIPKPLSEVNCSVSKVRINFYTFSIHLNGFIGDVIQRCLSNHTMK